MVAFRGHFDGKVIVADEPVDLKPGQRLIIQIEPIPQKDGKRIEPGSAKGQIEMADDFDEPLEDMGEYR